MWEKDIDIKEVFLDDYRIGPCDRFDGFINWWKHYDDFSYSSDKKQQMNSFEMTCGLYESIIEVGYFIVRRFFNTGKIKLIDDYSLYMDLLELGIKNPNDTVNKMLIDYLLYFSGCKGCKIIRISMKESFQSFYDYIKNNYNPIIDDDFMYLMVDNPIEFDDFKHMRIYSADAVGIDDLLFLYSKEYVIDDVICYKNVGNDLIIINRKNKKITMPKYYDGVPLFLTKKIYPLVAYISELHYEKKGFSFERININELSIINDFKKELIVRVNNDNALIFFDARLKDNYIDFLIKIKKEFKSATVYCITDNIDNTLNRLGYMTYDIKIDAELSSSLFWLDSKSKYSNDTKNAINEFNKRVEKLVVFGLRIKDPNIKFSLVILDLWNQKMRYFINDKKTEYSINKNDYIPILKRAYFYNWDSKYSGDSKNIDWKITIGDFDGNISYEGINETPKIWKYFIDELLMQIDKDISCKK